MKSKDLEKNILDLRHSVNLAKAGALFALGFSSWIAIFFGMKEFYSDIKIVISISTVVSIIFFYYALKFFKNCENIHDEVNKL